MKKTCILFIPLLLLGGLLGCSGKNDPAKTASQAYSSQEAIKRGDVVYLSEVYNWDVFERFMANLSNNQPDRIRVTGYTDEGDPIFKDLVFDGKTIDYTYDDSNDAFGGPNKGVRTNTCSTVTSEDSQGEVRYSISDCTIYDPEMGYFLLSTNKINR